MSKRYHPCYTNVNPAADARKYTSERVYYRKVTLEYDWLPPGREVESWFRRVPYRLERGEMEGSWIVKYFEFRAGIAPVPQLGFIGDLWISWNARDPSVWFKVEDMNWERWGGCVSSIHEQMNAKHPFLDKAYLWFSPKNFFFMGKLPDAKLSLRWERLQRIRRVAPTSRIIDPDSDTPPKKVPVNPVYLPSMRTIVRTMCPNLSQSLKTVPPPTPTKPVVGRGEGHGCGGSVVASTSRVRVDHLRGPLRVEEVVVGDDVEIDWDWWGSTDGEVEDETTEVGDLQPQLLGLTPTPSPITPSKSSRYHPYQFISSPTTPFRKFKPPSRYTKGTLDPNASPSDPYNTPVSSIASTSSTVVNPTTPTPRLTSEPINLGFTDEMEVVGPEEEGVLSMDETPYPQKPSQRTLEGIVRILREEGHDQSGVWALLPPELYGTGGDLAAELPVPILDLGRQTLHKIRRLLRQDGFAQHGILVLKMHDPSDDSKRWDVHNEMVKQDILAWI